MPVLTEVNFVAPDAPLNPGANWVSRAFAGMATTAMAESLNPHHVSVRADGEPVRVRLVDERTVVHVVRPHGLGALHLTRTLRSNEHVERLASISIANGDVTVAAFANHAWLNNVALTLKGGMRQARIAPQATHHLRLLEENGETTDLTIQAKPVHE